MQQHPQRGTGGKPYLRTFPHSSARLVGGHLSFLAFRWNETTCSQPFSNFIVSHLAGQRCSEPIELPLSGLGPAARSRTATLTPSRSRSSRSTPAHRSFADRNGGGAAAPLHAGPGAAAMGVVSGPPAAPRGGGHSGRAATTWGARRARQQASSPPGRGPRGCAGVAQPLGPGPRRTRPRGNRVPASASPRLGRKMEPEPGGHLSVETGAAAAHRDPPPPPPRFSPRPSARPPISLPPSLSLSPRRPLCSAPLPGRAAPLPPAAQRGGRAADGGGARGLLAPHFLVPAAAARRRRRGPRRETDISFEPAVEPVTNHWPEPGTNLQCGPGWLPPQIGCLVGQKMAAKEPVPARSPASRSRPALPPRRLPATRAGSSPQRVPSLCAAGAASSALPASFMGTEAPDAGRGDAPGKRGSQPCGVGLPLLLFGWLLVEAPHSLPWLSYTCPWLVGLRGK